MPDEPKNPTTWSAVAVAFIAGVAVGIAIGYGIGQSSNSTDQAKKSSGTTQQSEQGTKK
jgi:amino acid transporter